MKIESDTFERIRPTAPPMPEAAKGLANTLQNTMFALTAASTALILILLGADSGLSEALTSARQVEDLSKRWPEVQMRLYETALGKLPRSTTAYVSVHTGTGNSVKAANPPENLLLPLDLSEAQASAFQKWRFPEQDLTNPPHSLEAFKDFWNALNGGLIVEVPDFNWMQAVAESNEEEQGTCIATLLRRRPDHPDFRNLDCTIRDNPDLLQTKLPPIFTELSFAGQPQQGLEERVKNHESVDVFRTSAVLIGKTQLPVVSQADARKVPADLTVFIPYWVSHVSVFENSLRKFFSDWKDGTFDLAFPKLNEHLEEIGNVPLDKLADRVHELEERSQRDVEIFGLKLPKVDITRWGVTLLLAVQIYFWLSLKEFVRGFRAEWSTEVSWIALYKGASAFGLTLVAACFLPFIAALVISQHAVRSATHVSLRDTFTNITLGACAAILLVAADTCRWFLLLKAKQK